MAFTAYRTWVVAEIVTAALLNQQIRDNGRFIHGDDGPITLQDALIIDNSLGTEYVQIPSLTTAERDALTPVNGMGIYNETVGLFQFREAGAWKDLTADVTVITKIADETINNSLAPQDDNELAFAVGANEEWTGFLLLRFLSSAVADLRVLFSVPAGGAITGIGLGNLTSAGGSGAEVDYSADVTIPGFGAIYWHIIAFSYRGAAAGGTVTLQWAQWTAEATNTTIYAGSAINVWKS